MGISRAARMPYLVASTYIVAGALMAAFGVEHLARSFGIGAGLLIAAAAGIQIITNHHERKTHGRYRKALEAHRAGAGREPGDSSRPRSRGGSIRAGARMSGPFSSGAVFGPSGSPGSSLDAIVANMLQASSRSAVRAAMGISATADTAKSRPAGEFDGRNAEFAAGVVTGTRSFDVDKLGRLRGVAYDAVWLPGENEAKCLERPDPLAYYATVSQGRRARPSERPPHSIVDCAHGFYGYYEGSNDYYAPDRVMGVVEAYGETVIGSRGFRASKARIVALHIPAEVAVGTRRLIVRNYPEVATFDSFDAMVSEFPPDDAGHGLSPENDPDFWTRKA